MCGVKTGRCVGGERVVCGDEEKVVVVAGGV